MKNLTIEWTAKNSSTFLNGNRSAKTLRGAVRAARRYLRNELYGEGSIYIFVDGSPVRKDEISMFTGYRWQTSIDFGY